MSADSQELVSLAQRLRQQSRFADARAAAERALEIAPDHAEAWFNLGAALAGLERVEAAEAAYRRAWNTAALRGGLEQSGRPAQHKGGDRPRMTAYRRAMDANPGLAPVWSNLGNACAAHAASRKPIARADARSSSTPGSSRAGSTSAERCMRKNARPRRETHASAPCSSRRASPKVGRASRMRSWGCASSTPHRRLWQGSIAVSAERRLACQPRHRAGSRWPRAGR